MKRKLKKPNPAEHYERVLGDLWRMATGHGIPVETIAAAWTEWNELEPKVPEISLHAAAAVALARIAHEKDEVQARRFAAFAKHLAFSKNKEAKATVTSLLASHGLDSARARDPFASDRKKATQEYHVFHGTLKANPVRRKVKASLLAQPPKKSNALLSKPERNVYQDQGPHMRGGFLNPHAGKGLGRDRNRKWGSPRQEDRGFW